MDSGSTRASVKNGLASPSPGQHYHLYDDIWSQLDKMHMTFKGKGSTPQQPSRLQQYPDSGSVVAFRTIPPTDLAKPLPIHRHWPADTTVIQDHLCLPPLHEDDSFLSKALTNYRNVALSMLGSGMSLWEVFGPDPPNVDLLFRHRTANDAPNVSSPSFHVLSLCLP